jgi:hypothetical protein
MSKLSVVIPSRDERYLVPTIDDIFRNARGEIEVVAVIDSDKWPDDWASVAARHSNLHTIHHGEPRGMRAAINSGVASAKSRGAKFIAKFDGHCAFSEGFDEVLKADCEPDWIVVPRRKRLNPKTWTLTDTHKPDVDYHYLSFPDDPNDFGGPGLNGKIWPQRVVERIDYEIDEEMSSQGSGWFMHTDYFYRLELMDEASYGKFWNEFQELGLKCWLSGGRVMVNKRCWYAHWHKGKAGRGYHLPESWLQQGATFTKNWMFNDAWAGQTKPFKWLIEHFWPVPTWPDDWERRLYTERPPRLIGSPEQQLEQVSSRPEVRSLNARVTGLQIHKAHYGIGSLEDIDVRERLQNLAYLNNDCLDIVVNNATLTPGQNPFRGKKKQLNITYSYNGGDVVTATRAEKDWLIIGQVQQPQAQGIPAFDADTLPRSYLEQAGVAISDAASKLVAGESVTLYKSAAALNDYLIRKFSVSPQRLRAPMPIELRDFHRNDLAQLFAELGFKRGAEIGVAEGNYSEVLLKANPECELLLVDPWHAYSENPQNKSEEKHTYAFNEACRKTDGFAGRRLIMQHSMTAVKDVADELLNFVYIDGNHLFDYVMQDLIEWSKRVRSGGIVSGDDYYALDQKRWVGGGVVEAVQAYTNAHRIPVWYIFAGHKSVDFMWVKP